MYKAYKIMTLEDSLWISPELTQDLPSMHALTPHLAALQYPPHNSRIDKTGCITLPTLTYFAQNLCNLTHPNLPLPTLTKASPTQILISHRLTHWLLRIYVIIDRICNSLLRICLIRCFGAPNLCQWSVT